jgi:hypothetical protein
MKYHNLFKNLFIFYRGAKDTLLLDPLGDIYRRYGTNYILKLFQYIAGICLTHTNSVSKMLSEHVVEFLNQTGVQPMYEEINNRTNEDFESLLKRLMNDNETQLTQNDLENIKSFKESLLKLFIQIILYRDPNAETGKQCLMMNHLESGRLDPHDPTKLVIIPSVMFCSYENRGITGDDQLFGDIVRSSEVIPITHVPMDQVHVVNKLLPDIKDYKLDDVVLKSLLLGNEVMTLAFEELFIQEDIVETLNVSGQIMGICANSVKRRVQQFHDDYFTNEPILISDEYAKFKFNDQPMHWRFTKGRGLFRRLFPEFDFRVACMTYFDEIRNVISKEVEDETSTRFQPILQNENLRVFISKFISLCIFVEMFFNPDTDSNSMRSLSGLRMELNTIGNSLKFDPEIHKFIDTETTSTNAIIMFPSVQFCHILSRGVHFGLSEFILYPNRVVRKAEVLPDLVWNDFQKQHDQHSFSPLLFNSNPNP